MAEHGYRIRLNDNEREAIENICKELGSLYSGKPSLTRLIKDIAKHKLDVIQVNITEQKIIEEFFRENNLLHDHRPCLSKLIQLIAEKKIFTYEQNIYADQSKKQNIQIPISLKLHQGIIDRHDALSLITDRIDNNNGTIIELKEINSFEEYSQINLTFSLRSEDFLDEAIRNLEDIKIMDMMDIMDISEAEKFINQYGRDILKSHLILEITVKISLSVQAFKHAGVLSKITGCIKYQGFWISSFVAKRNNKDDEYEPVSRITFDLIVPLKSHYLKRDFTKRLKDLERRLTELQQVIYAKAYCSH